MIRVVLDSNIFVSAAIKGGGKPDRILRQGARKFELLISDYILSDVAYVLSQKRIQAKYRTRATPGKRATYLAKLRDAATVVVVKTKPSVLADPKDNLILACAKDGQADYIVTGDEHLLALGMFEGIKAVTPDQFLQILETESED